jgi:hypothetical protein
MNRDITVNSVVYKYRGDDKGIALRVDTSLGQNLPRSLIIGSTFDKSGSRRSKLEFANVTADPVTGELKETRALVQVIAPINATTADIDAVLDQVGASFSEGSPARVLVDEALIEGVI